MPKLEENTSFLSNFVLDINFLSLVSRESCYDFQIYRFSELPPFILKEIICSPITAAEKENRSPNWRGNSRVLFMVGFYECCLFPNYRSQGGKPSTRAN